MHDENAVAIIHFNHTTLRLLGHVPFLYSSTFKKFISLPNHTVGVLVTGGRINAGSGLEYVYNSNEDALQWSKKNLDNVDANRNKRLEDV